MACRFLEDPIEEEAVSLRGEFLICREIILRPLLDVLSLVFLCSFLHICIISSVCTSTESPLTDVLLHLSGVFVELRFFGFFYFALLLNGSFYSEVVRDVEHISEATVCDNLSPVTD